MRDSRCVSPSVLEDRRKQAVALFQNGMTRIEISEVVGAHRNTVGEWIRAWQKRGIKGLKVRAPGRRKGTGRILSPSQEEEICRCLRDKTPEQLDLDFEQWTRDAVRELVRERFLIEMPLRTISDYLKRWDFSL